MIKLTNLEKIYRTKEIETVALENVNLDIQKGEFLSIMGPSGCGKSTLLNIIGLLDAPTENDTPKPITCPVCDSVNAPNTHFCYKCGSKLD